MYGHRVHGHQSILEKCRVEGTLQPGIRAGLGVAFSSKAGGYVTPTYSIISGGIW